MATAMMMDTLQISRRLRDAGATEPVAEAMAKTFAESTAVVREDLATKTDLAALRLATKSESDALRSGMNHGFEAIRKDFRADLIASQNRILIAMAAMLATTAGALYTLLKLHA